MKLLLLAAPVLLAAISPSSARAQLAPGSMDVRWDAGSKDCAAYAHAPIQVHRYNARTFILRENPCDTWEAPFMYLLVGDTLALLIDTGDVADPDSMPLARTVTGLLPKNGGSRLPLLVVHTHGHLDHRSGDAQFEKIARVQVVRSDATHVREYFALDDWPNGTAEVDLGNRIVDVLPAPGHHPAHVVYYDRSTGMLFTGDFLLPGRLLVDDADAYMASALRIAAFVRDRPVSYVLGGHIERDRAGELLPWKSTYHPDEHVLQLSKADVLALPAALEKFNGFYTETDGYVIMNSIRILVVLGVATIVLLGGLGYLVYRRFRGRRAERAADFR